ncbi:Serine/threonine-protein kinase PrkC [Thalassoglobus neptunius]|uniref:non-specific serine/threonine protein kinase n=1 Tax=Thalassoglobus neptunius TaxID=1938619 RepID=A0A5C5V8T8_9PLAN|nr:serine/threonine-protein kinase [Thalassoglobus neptunius]TWT35014.1 Serine/threonine-protein kinase PrkC [Thalassoglobus neptunius]
MSDEETIGNLVITWCEANAVGQHVTVDELCDQHPELADEVAARIESLQAMQWLTDGPSAEHESDCPFPRHFAEFSNSDEEDSLPDTQLTIEQLMSSISASGLRTAESIQIVKDSLNGNCPKEFAKLLVREKLLTPYQARTFLTGSDEPIVLDEYEILDRIGVGGMGIVYRALHRTMDRVVASKILPREMVDSQEKVLRFQREVKTSAKLRHPNIVTTYDARQCDGIHFLVMEYIAGKNLDEIVKENGALSVSQSVNLILQAAHGLKHSHAQGIIHRDIKPGNLILDPSGRLKILDMGLARVRSTDADVESMILHNLTEAGAVMGTVHYMSPEQALDSMTADHRSDIYSLGCTLFHLLTGSPVYPEKTILKIVMAHQQAGIPSLKDFRNDVPNELDEICIKMLAKRPEDRFQSLSAVIEALESLKLDTCESSVALESPRLERSLVDTKLPETTGHSQSHTLKPSDSKSGSNERGARTNTNLIAFAGMVLVVGLASAFFLWPKVRSVVLQVENEESKVADDLDSSEDSVDASLTSRGNSEDDGEQILESDVAKWVLERGGKVRVESYGGESHFVTSPEMLPPGPLLLRGIYIETTDKRISDEDVKRFRFLKGLQLLNLNHQYLSESSIDIIANLPPLEQLSLMNCQVTDRALRKIVAAHPDLINLGFGNCPVTESGLGEIVKLKQLRSLFLITLPLTYDNFDQFKVLESLEVFYVTWTQLDDNGLEQLSKWPNLKKVAVTGTKVTDEGIRRFREKRPDCILITSD